MVLHAGGQENGACRKEGQMSDGGTPVDVHPGFVVFPNIQLFIGGDPASGDLFCRYQRFRIINGPVVVERYGLTTMKNGTHHQQGCFYHDPGIEDKIDIAYVIGVPLVPAEYAFEAAGRTTVASHL